MDKDSKSEKIWWMEQLAVFGKLSGWIAGPVIVATFFGKWMDEKFHSEPVIFLGCVGFSFIISMVVLVKKAGEEINKIK